MPYLAIDTASRWTAIALYDEGSERVLSEKGWTATLRQTVELAPAINQMLKDAQLSASDLTALAVAIGPGSYTGLRIGLSLARGLSLVHDLPIAAIRTHDIVAKNIPYSTRQLLVAVEAGRKRVLIAPYVWQDDHWIQDGAIDNPTWPELIERVDQPSLIAGEISEAATELLAECQDLIVAAPTSQSVRSAGTLAKLGHMQIQSGQLVNQDSLAPFYLRNP